MQLSEIRDMIAIGLTALAVILFVVAWILKHFKNKKAKKIAKSLESAAHTALQIKNATQSFIAKAEDFIDYDGNDKAQWVITNVKEYCIENNIPYNVDDIRKNIEEFISFSKKVNAGDKKRNDETEYKNSDE